MIGASRSDSQDQTLEYQEAIQISFNTCTYWTRLRYGWMGDRRSIRGRVLMKKSFFYTAYAHEKSPRVYSVVRSRSTLQLSKNTEFFPIYIDIFFL